MNAGEKLKRFINSVKLTNLFKIGFSCIEHFLPLTYTGGVNTPQSNFELNFS